MPVQAGGADQRRVDHFTELDMCLRLLPAGAAHRRRRPAAMQRKARRTTTPHMAPPCVVSSNARTRTQAWSNSGAHRCLSAVRAIPSGRAPPSGGVAWAERTTAAASGPGVLLGSEPFDVPTAASDEPEDRKMGDLGSQNVSQLDPRGRRRSSQEWRLDRTQRGRARSGVAQPARDVGLAGRGQARPT
jgi:hypothetical protein